MTRRPQRPQQRSQRREIDLDEVVYGVHAVAEALSANEALRHLHVAIERRRDPVLREVLALAGERAIPVRFEDRAYFTQFPYKAHQGVIAFGAPFPYVGLDDVLSSPRTGPLLLVVLDHLTDPHNLGAILRSAECAGASGIVIPERRACGVNATVRKAAAGAAARMPVARVANVAQTVGRLKKAGVWVAGAAGEGSQEFTKADFTGDLALVIGAEGAGLSPLVRRECDYLVRIPVLGSIGSLNASVAAGVLLYEAVRQRAGCSDCP